MFSFTKSFSFSGTSSPRPPIGSLPLDPAGGKGVDLTGLLGDIKEDWGSGGLVPQKLKLFYEIHIIFALKYNKQQLLSLESTS